MLPTAPSEKSKSLTSQSRLNGRLALICLMVFSGMIGAAYASVPLYKRFCQLTGFGGTVRQADAAPTTVLERPITIRFDTNVRDLPWSFKAEQNSQTLKIGSTGLAFFKVTNSSNQTLTGRASYNVVPDTAGPYFQKLECFCFKAQTLKPGQSIDFPVVYFVDPKFATDEETRGTQEITLSYTFFQDAKSVGKQAGLQVAPGNGSKALGVKPSAGL
jgi:cytochrome c oxidase assembly protein subunit 11